MDRVKAGFTLTNEVRPLAAFTLLTELSTHTFIPNTRGETRLGFTEEAPRT